MRASQLLGTILVAGGLLAVQAPAFAAPIVIGDQLDVAATRLGADYAGYSSSTFANQLRGGRHWGDSIQGSGDPFDTTQITITRNDSINRIDIDLRTWFDGAFDTARYADLFIDTNTTSTFDNFNYAISLGAQGTAAGVYGVTSTKNANDIWGARSGVVYGGYTQFKTTSSSYNASMALTPPVRLQTGIAMPQYTVAVTKTAISGGLYNVNVAITSSTNLSLFDNFDIFWGTADCSNDAVWGTAFTASTTNVPVPAPAAMSLFLFGLAGIGAARRRTR